MAGVVSFDQMLRTPYVTGVVSRVKPAGRAFQQFYSMSPTDSPSEQPMAPGQRHLVYDIFDNTRTNAQLRAPMVGPAHISAKPIGQSHATAVRMYEAIQFPYEKVYGTRDLGGQYGTMNATGKSWVARQQMFAANRMTNAVEFMVSRMFRGGFSVTMSGDQATFGEYSASGYTFNVEYNIPAGNKTDIGGIIDVAWSNAASKIINHMLEINKYSQLLTGYEIKHCWINSTTFKNMIANTQLNTVRGTAMRVFEEYKAALVETNGEARNIGFQVVFPAMPQFIWHIYDGTSVVSSQTDPATHTTSNNSLYIPDNICIMTPEPEPGGWYGHATCSEVIKENDISPPTIKTGLEAWSYPMNDPPGEEMRMLLNYVPLLYVPKSVFYATVIF
jgi:hypothetical protein